MIYDCFTFFDETDVLEIRLHELDPVVDRFVLVEASQTFSGRPKPLYFELAKPRYRRFAGRIVHVVVDDMDAAKDVRGLPFYAAAAASNPTFRALLDRNLPAWSREAHQRNGIARGLAGCQGEDVILIGDVDEIPRASSLRQLSLRDGTTGFRQRLHYYYLNCRADSDWVGTRAIRYQALARTAPQEVRTETPGAVVEEGGWHFSHLGGIEAIRRKIASFSHQELNTPEFNAAASLLFNVENNLDIYARGNAYSLVEIDRSYPEHVRRHLFRYRRLVRRDRYRDANTLRLRAEVVRLRRENEALRGRLGEAGA
jgi:beta-1,4-mannosyl-glycoprotein beta-1,4-N-acetylglucosaminyltransferase